MHRTRKCKYRFSESFISSSYSVSRAPWRSFRTQLYMALHLPVNRTLPCPSWLLGAGQGPGDARVKTRHLARRARPLFTSSGLRL